MDIMASSKYTLYIYILGYHINPSIVSVTRICDILTLPPKNSSSNKVLNLNVNFV